MHVPIHQFRTYILAMNYSCLREGWIESLDPSPVLVIKSYLGVAIIAPQFTSSVWCMVAHHCIGL